jgi:hypothetical protein
LKATGALRQPDWFVREVAIVAECASVDLTDLTTLAHQISAVASEPLRSLGHEGRALGFALDEARVDLIRLAQA